MRRGLTSVTAVTALALVPSAATATPRYVDVDFGADSDPTCPISAPCETITYAIANSATNDEILVDNGVYPESVTLGNGRSLRYDNFYPGDGANPVIVDGGATTAVTVPASGAGSIRGLTLRGDANGIVLNGTAEVDGNTFDDPDATSAIGLLADLGASGASIHDNTFLDPAPSTTRGRAGVSAALAGVYIVDNSFAGFNVAIQAGGGGSIVQGNQITGTHNLPFVGRSILAGGAGTVTVRENSLSAASGSSVIGIDAATGAMLIRNEVTGHEHGVTVNFNISGITLNGDRIWGNSGDGLRISDNLPEDPRTSVTATNVTIVDNTLDIRLSGVDSVDLTLDSSIIETILFSESTCAITFSRADAIGADPSGCDGFQTTADPMLADPAIGDLHLEPDSPMLDLGNPADPGVGAVDFDGDPRAVAATCGDVSRRDIGSDEFVPDCDPPETTIDSGPGDGEAINEATPAIAFSSDDPAATFECRVEPAGFGLCSHTYQHILGPLGEGSYTFAVRAVDVAENEDPTPAQRTFTVDLTDPKTRFTRTPPRKTERKRVKFGFDADEEATFECRLDSRPRFECESPERMKVMPGRHQFRVVGTDEAGNPDPTPAMFRFRRLRPR